MERAGDRSVLQEARLLQAAELPFEFCMNALRLHQGVAREAFAQRTGRRFEELCAPLREAEGLGLIERSEARLMPSETGRRYQNRLLELFL